MCESSIQIKQLFLNGHTAEEISELLQIKLTDILLILNSLGCLTPKKIKKNMELNAEIKSPMQIIDTTNSEDVNKINATSSGNIIKEETAEEICARYKSQVMRKLCEVATSEPDEQNPLGVIVKAAIYVNEEATGRNEARAKKSSVDSTLLSIAEVMRQAQLASERVNAALGLPSNNIKKLPSTIVEV